jgi:hypothetical protein
MDPASRSMDNSESDGKVDLDPAQLPRYHNLSSWLPSSSLPILELELRINGPYQSLRLLDEQADN